VALLVLDGFAAVAAIGGGLALLSGLEGDRFPRAWLSGTPFDGYGIPAMILVCLVGGSSAVAFATTLRGPTAGARASLLAGLVMVGWIAGEIVILSGDAEVVSPTEIVFLAVGLATTGLGWWVSRAGQAAGPNQGDARP
jgi:hypothetical protein